MAMLQHFKTSLHNEALLELISNQLQLLILQGQDEIKNAHLKGQKDALRMKIINQRAELGVTVDGI